MLRKGKVRNVERVLVYIGFILCMLILPSIGKADQTDVSHQTHLIADRGPRLGNECVRCHISVSPSEADVEYDLCIACHSPDGMYNGWDDFTIGAIYNWGKTESQVYTPEGSIRPEKTKWCGGCHDDGTCEIGEVSAPNIVGK